MNLSPVFQYKTHNTHMPFILKWRNSEILLFSSNTEEKKTFWMPCYTDWNDENDPIHPLNIGNNESICNICGVTNKNEMIISYIATDAQHECSLYETKTKNLLDFFDTIQLQKNCWTGFSTYTSIVYTHINTLTIRNKENQQQTHYTFNNFDTIFRAGYISKDKLILTVLMDEKFRTFTLDYHDTQSPLLYEIVVSELDEIYKSIIYQNYLVLAKGTPESQTLNDRNLFFVDEYSLVPRPEIVVSIN